MSKTSTKRTNPYKIMLEKCLAVRSGDIVLIVTDKKKKVIANRLLEEAQGLVRAVGLVEISERNVDGQEPPEFVSAALKKCNVALLVTSKSLTHTIARKQASEIGVRIASLPNVTEDIINRAIDVDYDLINKTNTRLIEMLHKTDTIIVQSSKGTNIKFRRDPNRTIYNDSGLFHSEGEFGNLPAGEVFFSPAEGSADGVFVIDGSVIGEAVDKPVKVEVKAGFATNITGGRTAKKLLNTITPLGKESFNIAELGIGTNPRAKISGNVLEDEKVIGTCHIALGNSMSFGGRVYAKSHLDGIIRNPTIFFDKKKIMDKGKLLIGKV